MNTRAPSPDRLLSALAGPNPRSLSLARLRSLGPQALLAAAFVVQDVDVRSATIALQPTTIAVEMVTVENRRSSPLVAWEIGLSRPGENRASMAANSDFSWQVIHPSSTSGPINPSERRAIELELADRDLGQPTLRLAVFADGYIEGVADVIDRWHAQRRERAEDAAYWVRAFESMPVSSDDNAKQHLAARAAERAVQVSGDPSGIRGRLWRIWIHTPRPPGWLSAVIDPIRREAERQLAVLTQRSTTAPALESASPVVLSSKRAALTEYVAVVKNLRDVPIEAVGFEILEPGGRRSGQTADYCTADRASPGGGGRISPGESREFRLDAKIRDEARLPTLRISFVIFADLVYEGEAAKRDALFRAREQQADDIAFANTVRAGAMTKSGADVLAFLVARRAERDLAMQTQGRQPRLRLLDDLIEQAKRSPESLRENSAVAQELERQRGLLLRHLKR
jgi:hypothetical protein